MLVGVDQVFPVVWSFGVPLVVFFCSRNSVLLFDTPGIYNAQFAYDSKRVSGMKTVKIARPVTVA